MKIYSSFFCFFFFCLFLFLFSIQHFEKVSELESQCRYANELESQKDFDGAESVYERLANSQICLEYVKHAKESDAQMQTISREYKENEVNKTARSILQDEKTHFLVVFTLKHYALLLARKNSYEKQLCALARLADALFIDESDTTLWIEFVKLSRATHQLYLAKTGIDFCLQTSSLAINPLIIKYAIEVFLFPLFSFLFFLSFFLSSFFFCHLFFFIYLLFYIFNIEKLFRYISLYQNGRNA